MGKERMKILKLVEDGKITAEEAARLIKALGKQDQQRSQPSSGTGEWLRIHVTNLDTGANVAKVTLPMRLVDVGLKLGSRFIPEVEGVQLEMLSVAIQEGMTGKLMEFVDEEDGQLVEIFVD